MRSLLRWAKRLILGAAWGVVITALALVVLEESGVLVGLVRRSLASRLGPLGQDLDLERVGLRWFEPALVLEGLSLSQAEAGRRDELVRFKSLHVALDLRGGRPRLERVTVLGGRVRFGEGLYAAVERFAQWNRTRARPPLEDPPTIAVVGCDLALELPDATEVELGRLDLVADEAQPRRFLVRGQLVPAAHGSGVGRGAIYVEGDGSPDGVRLRALARALPVDSSGAASVALAGLPLTGFGGLLDLEAEAQIDLGAELVTRGSLRARVERGRLATRGVELEDASLALDARFQPAQAGGLWRPSSWAAAGRFDATWMDEPVHAFGMFGKELRGAIARVWMRAPRLALDGPTSDALGLSAYRRLIEAYSLEGRLDTALELRLTTPAEGGPGLVRELGFHARAQGPTVFTFFGERNEAGEREGFPVPCRISSGEVLASYSPGLRHRWRVGLADVRGDPGSGSASAQGLFAAAPADDLTMRSWLDLELRGDSVAIDERLHAGFEANPDLRPIWPTYSPSGGTASAEWRLHRGPDTGGLSAHGLVRVAGTRVLWSEVPAPFADASGELEIAWGARPTPVIGSRHPFRPIGVAYRFWNAPTAPGRTGAVARIDGASRQETPAGSPPLAREDLPRQLTQGLALEIDDLLLRGRDWELLTRRFPELGREVEFLSAKGGMDVRFYGSRHATSAPYASCIEATPRIVEITPQFFQRRTRNLSGRVLIQTSEPAPGERVSVETRVTLSGQWPDGVELAARGSIPAAPGQRASIHVFGAGIDPTNMAFKGAFAQAFAASEGRAEGMDLSDQHLSGRFDFRALTEFDALAPGPRDSRYVVFLRNNDLASENFSLDELRGVLEQDGDVWSSPRIEARLGGHPIELSDVRIFRLGDARRIADVDPILLRSGFWNDPDGSAFQANLSTRDMPLDSARLSALMGDEGAPGAARPRSGWAGELDVDAARIVMTSEANGEGKLALHGLLRPHDMLFSLGLPLAVHGARVDAGEVIVEAGRVRGWGRIDGLQADIAGRTLSDAHMIVSYVDGRLTVDDLAGAFVDGKLASLGGERQGGTALAIDLSDPHGFDLRVEMTDVRVDLLLKGVFHSTIADQGTLDVGLRLKGKPADVLGVTGSGWLSLDDGQLWSIPVMRELFGQLGFDQTAIFKSMRARFQIRDGVVAVSELKVLSDLLNLVGSGELDFDGRLDYDLEVRYGLIDRLGPINKILYWFNNNLWRIAIRGDMDRPVVVIRNTLFEFLRGFEEREARALPLPGFAPAPERF